MNPHKGEVALMAGEKTYVLRLSINAIAEIEDLMGEGIEAIIRKTDRVGTLRAILWGALREHHSELSLFDAGDIIGEIGAPAAGEKIGEALKLAFPVPEGDARPQIAAQGGTGRTS
ncbi:MAG: GTA-gp10 family protein [Hyphomicrobium sp.]|jgi:hypothetical protein